MGSSGVRGGGRRRGREEGPADSALSTEPKQGLILDAEIMT